MGGADPQTFVRDAGPDDAVVLQTLEMQARALMVDQRGGRRRLAERPPIAEGWADVVDAAHRGVAVAGVDGVVMGWLTVQGPDDHGAATIDSVYVEEGARELGLGDDLVAWAMSWARSRGATSIESWALPGDRATKNLFERQGLTARLITVSRALSDPASSADASR